MKKLIAFAAATLLTSSVIAGTHTVYDHNNLHTGSFASKSEAYEAGFDIAEQVSGMSQSQLRSKLRFTDGNLVRNIKVDNTKVTVEEFAESRGKISYRATVNVAYTYKARESNND